MKKWGSGLTGNRFPDSLLRIKRPPATHLLEDAVTNAEQQEQHERMGVHEREALCALIGERILHILGEPSNLCRLHVRPLWKDHYRVNVVVGADVTCAKIANSYFVR